jgi:predicted outer membrane repeat protein
MHGPRVYLGAAALMGAVTLLSPQAALSQGPGTPPLLLGPNTGNVVTDGTALFWRKPPLPSACSESAIEARQAEAGGAAAADAGPIAADHEELIVRAPVGGGETRILYRDPTCSYQIGSNLVVDDAYVYWVNDTQPLPCELTSPCPRELVRLSRNANPGDPWEVIAPILSNDLAQNAEYVVGGGWEFTVVRKADGAVVYNVPLHYRRSRLTVDGSGRLWYLENGTLYRSSIPTTQDGPPPPRFAVAQNVTDFHAEGERTRCPFGSCDLVDYTYYVQGDVLGTSVVRYNGITDTHRTLYTTTYPHGADIRAISSAEHAGGYHVYFYEMRLVCGSTGCNSLEQNLMRIPALGGSESPPELLHFNTIPAWEGHVADPQVITAGGFVFFKEYGGHLMRLPQDAQAIHRAEITITGVEVTQGVQSYPSPTVPIVERRRTFVRVYVQRTDLALPAHNVTARLRAKRNSVPLQPVLLPANGMFHANPMTSITVYAGPSRNLVDDGFLFELPWDWTHGTVDLEVEVNPFKNPVETNYADNKATRKVTFQPPSGLLLMVNPFSYQVGGVVRQPGSNDVNDIVDYLRKTYPLRADWWPTVVSTAFDAGLASRVDLSHSDCQKLGDDRDRCPFFYINAKLAAYRENYGNPLYLYFYGIFRDPPGPTDGMAFHVNDSDDFDYQVASGDSDDPEIAAHEIGHLLGRDHPFKGSQQDTKVCEQDDDFLDHEYPHRDGRISPDDGSVMGFDPGDGLKLSTSSYDFMTYCDDRWISDHTFHKLRIRMGVGSPSPAPYPDDPPGPPFPHPHPGDFLTVHGTVAPGGAEAVLHVTQRLAAARQVSAAGSGPYRLQQLDLQGNVLAEQAFTARPDSDGSTVSFGVTVSFNAGTREIRVLGPGPVSAAGLRTLASKRLSPTRPEITRVALQNPPSPLSGLVTLAWQARDADGDPLNFDVLVSRNGGGSYEPLFLGLKGLSVSVDTERLSGTVLFRVVASDGVHTFEASTVPYAVAPKPPRPRITAPSPEPRLIYGQTLNLSGEATDAHDGTITGAGLVWTNQDQQVLGTGGVVTLINLKAGVNVITLTATNRLQLSASTSITVQVDDVVGPPPASLAVTPGTVHWSVQRGAGPQHATLSIVNGGGGVLAWEASADADWLPLGTVTGGAPSTLVLTADPSGLAPGTVLEAVVRIRSTNLPQEQAIEVPVTLSVKDEPAVVVGNGTAASCTPEALRAALDAVHAAGGGRVRFACGAAPHTIVPASTLSIRVPVAIDGGDTITLSGAKQRRVFELCSPGGGGAEDVELKLTGLTLADGRSEPNRAGGAITNYGCRLTISRTRFLGNTAVFEAGAIHSLFEGTVTIDHSRFVGNTAATIGGAIVIQGGRLTVRRTTFRDNRAGNGNGGAIYAYDPAVVDVARSAFIANQTTLRGGALSAGGQATIANSTFWENTAVLGGAAVRHHSNGGPLTLANVTVWGSQGKAVSGGVTMANSVVGNPAGLDNCDGPIAALGPNLEFPAGTCQASLQGLDPLLVTPSHDETVPPTAALQADSPARDAGSNPVCAAPPVGGVDQRGVPRPHPAGGACDLGAYELDPSSIPPGQ